MFDRLPQHVDEKEHADVGDATIFAAGAKLSESTTRFCGCEMPLRLFGELDVGMPQSLGTPVMHIGA
jgi:hypothetical protein